MVNRKNNNIEFFGYHKWRRDDVREEVHRNPSADEHRCSQAGKPLAVAPAGRVGPGIVTNHHPSLLQVLKTLLQVVTETLSGKNTRQNVQWTFNSKDRKPEGGGGQ